MSTLDPLVRDLVVWVAGEPKPYAEVIEAWRTSCPRLTVWEDAVDRGYVERRTIDSKGVYVFATPEGLDFIRRIDGTGSSDTAVVRSATDQHSL